MRPDGQKSLPMFAVGFQAAISVKMEHPRCVQTAVNLIQPLTILGAPFFLSSCNANAQRSLENGHLFKGGRISG